MAVYYLEPSALVKRYIREVGSPVIDELFQGLLPNEGFVTSEFSRVETVSAFARLRREGRLTVEGYGELRWKAATEANARIRLLSVPSEIIARAVDLLSASPLSAGDALHVASALAVGSALPGEALIYVCADRQAVTAARVAGLAILNPLAPTALADLRALRA